MKQIITALVFAVAASTASAQIVEETPLFLTGTGLTTGATIGIITSVVVLGAVINDDDESGTTTTTTTTK